MYLHRYLHRFWKLVLLSKISQADSFRHLEHLFCPGAASGTLLSFQTNFHFNHYILVSFGQIYPASSTQPMFLGALYLYPLYKVTNDHIYCRHSSTISVWLRTMSPSALLRWEGGSLTNCGEHEVERMTTYDDFEMRARVWMNEVLYDVVYQWLL